MANPAPNTAGLRPPWTSETCKLVLPLARAALDRKRNGEPTETKPAKVRPDETQRALKAQLQLVREQVRSTRLVLNDTAGQCPKCSRGPIEPHHRAQLLKALDTLLNRERILLGVHEPGPLKAHEPRQPRRQSWLIEAQPAVVVTEPVKVLPPAPGPAPEQPKPEPTAQSAE